MKAPLAIAILAAACATMPPSATLFTFRVRPGRRAPRDASAISVVHRGSLCYRNASDRGVVFRLDTDCATDIIESIDTSDPRFRTREELRVGSTLQQAVEAGGGLVETSSQCEVYLPSGWIAVARRHGDRPCSDDVDQAIESFAARAPLTDAQ